MRISAFSKGLVLAQMLCIGSLVLSGRIWPTLWFCKLLLLAALFIFAAALWSFRRSRLSVFPEPRSGAQLLQRGIYQYIRHPLYTAVLLGTAAYLPAPWALWRLAVWLLLLVVLLQKIKWEEQLLLKTYSEYAAYRQRSWHLLPGVY